MFGITLAKYFLLFLSIFISLNLIKILAMKKLLFALGLIALTASFSYAGVSQYYVDDNAVESLFQTSSVISVPNIDLPQNLNNTNMPVISADKNPWVAFAVCYFVGALGIHRLYLGTKTIVFIAYLCTGGIFGIAYVIDAIVLLIGAINDDISKYVDNEKLFMWL